MASPFAWPPRRDIEDPVVRSRQRDCEVASAAVSRTNAPRVHRRGRGVSVAAALGVTASLVAVAPASAADDCANAAVRAQQLHGSQLPDCRAYELVSPVEKNGRGMFPERFFSANGDQILVTGPGPLLESLSGLSGHIRAERGANGWTATSVAGPTPGRFPSLADSLDLLATNEDLTKVLTRTSYPFDPGDQGAFNAQTPLSSRDLYRFGPGGVPDWLSSSVDAPDVSSQTVDLLGASPDLRTAVMQTNRRLAPEVADESVTHLYVRVDGQPTRLVTVLPDGTPVTGRPTSALASASADATRVAFETGTAGSRRLYVRLDADDPARARTVDPTLQGGVSCANSGLEELSPDGSRVRFTCFGTPLLPGTPSGYYERNLDTGALRDVGRVGTYSTRTDDFSLVVGGFGGVQLSRDGVLETVFPTANAGISEMTAAISPNERYITFEAGQPVGRPEFGSEYQVYRYELATRELRCVSCPTDGSVPSGRGYLRHPTMTPASVRNARLNQVTDDGRVFFTTSTPLVPDDTNGVNDVYVWDDGTPRLLTPGTSRGASELVGATADARTVFVTSYDDLVPQDVDHGLRDVYALRVDGGFLVPEDAPACRDACQGPIGGPAPAPPVATVSFVGPVDPVADDDPKPGEVRVSGKRTVRGTSAKIKVRVPGTGRVKSSGFGLRAVTRSARKAGNVNLPVRLSERSRSALKRRGRLTVRATVRYTPTSGEAQTTRLSVTFKQQKTKKKKPKNRTADASRSATNGKGGR
jgi:hypothetical protein